MSDIKIDESIDSHRELVEQFKDRDKDFLEIKYDGEDSIVVEYRAPAILLGSVEISLTSDQVEKEKNMKENAVDNYLEKYRNYLKRKQEEEL